MNTVPAEVEVDSRKFRLKRLARSFEALFYIQQVHGYRFEKFVTMYGYGSPGGRDPNSTQGLILVSIRDIGIPQTMIMEGIHPDFKGRAFSLWEEIVED